jgi:hypothetical protein
VLFEWSVEPDDRMISFGYQQLRCLEMGGRLAKSLALAGLSSECIHNPVGPSLHDNGYLDVLTCQHIIFCEVGKESCSIAMKYTKNLDRLSFPWHA